ncbi:MAG: BatD family protein [Verrucomicrobiota bacterium]
MVNPLHQLAKWIAALTLAFIGLTAAVSAAEVEAQLDRESVPAGNGAILTLKISGGRAGRPEIPPIANFIIEPRGRNQQMQVIGGQTTVSSTYTYVVGATVPGDYQIPAIEVTVDGQKLSSKPLKLKVLAAGAAQPPAGIQPTPPGTPPPGEEAADTGEKRFGFLTVELADSKRQHVYVGEIAPVRIRAWLPADSRVELRSGIQPEGKAFTLHNVSGRPQQTQEMKDGKRYVVVTWFGGISATKAGKYPASLSVDATVAVRDTSVPQPRRRNIDPFFGILGGMNTPMIQKDVTLKSDDQEIEVRPLPVDGRPGGFTGAVGEFKFDSAEIPNDWKTGEPQQITTRLIGSGNFALMNAPELTPADAWKTYSGKDEFTPGDQASFSGSKIFQFSAVPRKGGGQEAALAFSYFDPAAESYKTITSAAKQLSVAGADMIDVEPAVTPAAKEPEKKKVATLVAQHLVMSPPGSLVPLVSRPAFTSLLVVSALLSVLGKVLAWLRVRREDPRRRALAAMEKATREALETAGHCAAARDVTGWFAAARLAIQQRLGALWNQPPQAITLAEVTARIPDDSPVTRFIREADHHEYSRQDTGEILPEWRSLLDEAMASLTPSAR